jgi:spore maturation protein CgeB
MMGRVLLVTFEFGGLPIGFLDNLIGTFEGTGNEFKTCSFGHELELYASDFNPTTYIFFHPWMKDFESKGEVIDKLGGHKILWSMEDPYEIDLIVKYHHHFGYILTTDKNSAEYLQKTVGKGTHLPHGAIPNVHKPMEVPWQYRSDLCFIGNAFPSRLRFFRKVLPYLKDYHVLIGGTGWAMLNDIYGQHVINCGVSAEDYIRYINGAKVNLNLHRLVDDMSIANENHIMPSSPNNRFFEIQACRGVQMVDDSRNPEIFEYYNRTEITDFDVNNTEDFVRRFEFIVSDKELRMERAKKAYDRTLKDHIYERRFAQILGELL